MSEAAQLDEGGSAIASQDGIDLLANRFEP
jgi:hypothetical protein